MASPAGGHICHICGRAYKRRDTMLLHVRKHQGLTTCGRCGKVLPTRSDLRRHLVRDHGLSREQTQAETPHLNASPQLEPGPAAAAAGVRASEGGGRLVGSEGVGLGREEGSNADGGDPREGWKDIRKPNNRTFATVDRGSGRADGEVDTRTVYSRTVDAPGVNVDDGGVRSPLLEFVDTEGE